MYIPFVQIPPMGIHELGITQANFNTHSHLGFAPESTDYACICLKGPASGYIYLTVLALVPRLGCDPTLIQIF